MCASHLHTCASLCLADHKSIGKNGKVILIFLPMGEILQIQGRIQEGTWGAQAPPQPRQHTGFNGHLAEHPALVAPSSQETLIWHIFDYKI